MKFSKSVQMSNKLVQSVTVLVENVGVPRIMKQTQKDIYRTNSGQPLKREWTLEEKMERLEAPKKE